MSHTPLLRTLSALLLVASIGALTACNDDTRPAGGALDCGQGERVDVGADSFCVFSRDLVIENGFACPTAAGTLTLFGPIGVCSEDAPEPAELEELAGADRSQHPDRWAETECIRDADCDSAERCEDARCEADDEAPTTCEEGQARYLAEFETISSCSADADCGQELLGTSCGCTRNLVDRADASTDAFFALQRTLGELGCDTGASTCDCPAADGFACVDNRCTWNYTGQ